MSQYRYRVTLEFVDLLQIAPLVPRFCCLIS